MYNIKDEQSNFGYTDVKKSAFHKSKYPIDINEVNIGKIVISNKVLYGKKGFKYFVRYKGDDKIKRLCIMLSKISACVKMSFLNAYNKVWDKISNIMQKQFDSDPGYNEKYLKTKIKSSDGKIS